MRQISETTPTGPAAFEDNSDIGRQAQAAILLALGAELRGDPIALAATAASVDQSTDMFTSQTLDEFPIPAISPASRRIDVRTIRPDVIRDSTSLVDLAADVYATRTVGAAAVLAAAALDHPDELVRVAAAHAAIAVTTEPQLAYRRLVEGTQSDEELVREVAATSLARYNPDDPALRKLIAPSPTPDERPAHTSTLVHGTFAANATWWRPGGVFFTFVAASVWNDLYAASDFYSWSGGYSDGARNQGADFLTAWIRAKGATDLSLMTHSHGGSVAMLASWRGVTLGDVVLLSCPVHPSKYTANFAAVGKVTSIRVKLDLVLLADGSGSRFNDPRYHDHVLPVWFNHSATHDPGVWRTYNVKAML